MSKKPKNASKLIALKIGDTCITQERYGLERIITKISENEYTLEGKSRYGRGGTTKDGSRFFDLEGGPFYAVGDKLRDVDDDRRIIDFEGMDTDKKDYAIIKLTMG